MRRPHLFALLALFLALSSCLRVCMRTSICVHLCVCRTRWLSSAVDSLVARQPPDHAASSSRQRRRGRLPATRCSPRLHLGDLPPQRHAVCLCGVHRQLPPLRRACRAPTQCAPVIGLRGLVRRRVSVLCALRAPTRRIDPRGSVQRTSTTNAPTTQRKQRVEQ